MGARTAGPFWRAAEASVAFVASAAFFVLAAAGIPARDQTVVVVLLGGVYVYVVLLAAKRLGPLYGVPFAIAGGLAFDSFYIPPTREFGADNWQNWLVMVVYISMGVLIGMLGASSVRRAEGSERARGALAEEQVALRRVATLVARNVPPAAVFAAVAREVGLLLDVDVTHIGRYEDDGTVTGVAAWSRSGDHVPVGSRSPVEGNNVTALVLRTGRPARMDSYEHISGSIAVLQHSQLGIHSSVGAPIVVAGRLWGVMIASSKHEEPLPADTESRIAGFTELAATAISNAQARAEVTTLADEQAALRRVATLVAKDAPSSDLFGAVTEEVGKLLGADLAGMTRFESGDLVTAVATWAAVGEHPEVGGRWPLETGNLGATIARTGRPTRIDNYSRIPGRIGAFMRDTLGTTSSAGSPIVVEGQLWGALYVHSTHDRPLPADTESRLTSFTELVATAIANAQARSEVGRLADEQAALRRVATLVAREPSAAQVFAAVAEEVGRLLGVDDTKMFRFEADDSVTVVAEWGDPSSAFPPVGARLPLDGEGVAALVRRTERPARIDDYATVTGSLGAAAREAGFRSVVGAPIVVGGRVWGVIAAAATQSESLPAGTESRIEEFTELVATAISNTEARSDLAASRARIVAAADDERRRVVRDLHDGAQQRLVHTVITLKMARQAIEREEDAAPTLVGEALDQAESAMAELRDLAQGILPSVLTWGGLPAGVEALASRMPVPVDIDISVGRLSAPIEASAYFVVAEALTNVAKHARAQHAAVMARMSDGTLQVEIEDDGIGTADPGGQGLLGLADRLASLDGVLRVVSVPAQGTKVIATVPVR
ncbi:MAG: GAF domain-containing protein [Thermoleophilaceae bacterium]